MSDLAAMEDGRAPMPVQAAGLDVRGRIRDRLEQGDLDGALLAIESVVEEVFCEPLNVAEIFGDAFLDEACQRVGVATLASLGSVRAESQAGTVFVASRLQPSGGHTALLADIARLAQGPVRILLTGISGPTDPARLAHRFGGIPDLVFEQAPRGTRLARLQWLQARLRALRPRTLWLFNHHQDSVAVAAVQPGQGYTLKYLHHGDHHLCLGVCLPWGEHYDPHAMGWHNCREVLGRPDNRYLPMALEAPVAPAIPTRRSGALVTCTAAGHNKIEHDYGPAYAEVIAAVLARTGGTHLHIGRLTLPYRWRIRRALARQGVAGEAFRYVSHVPNLAEALVREQVDVYLSSFPIAGARTLIEAMAAGLPIAVHDHAGKRFLGALDMAPEGSCVWSAPEDLLSFLGGVDRASLLQMGELSRRHYEAYHSPAVMRSALLPDAPPVDVPTLRFTHRGDSLVAALHRGRQFSVSGLLRRWVFRTARRVKSIVL